MSHADKQREFERLFSSAEPDLYRYVVALVPSDADAVDVLQETAIALWEKFNEYDASRPFGPWARRFAHVQVLKLRLYRQRERTYLTAFREETLAAISEEYELHLDVLEAREEALAGCLDQLGHDDRTLVTQRYWDEANLREIAAAAGKQENQLYRRLRKIRDMLHDCIDRTLADEDQS